MPQIVGKQEMRNDVPEEIITKGETKDEHFINSCRILTGFKISKIPLKACQY